MKHLTILSPASLVVIPRRFRNVTVDARRHDELIVEMQRLRGSIYLSEGAIQPGDLTDGCHRVDVDEHGWHLLALDADGLIYGCLRYSEMFSVARYVVMDDQFREALEDEMRRARRTGRCFGEVGGWAVSAAHRSTRDAWVVILAMRGLMQVLGGCAAIATATARHNSAAMLKRLGLTPLALNGVDLPAYYDSTYRCEMEMLCFDSRTAKQSREMESAAVICRQRAVA